MPRKKQYPEHRKMQAVKGDAHTIGQFLEWLQSQGIELCVSHRHSEDCGADKWGRPLCGLRADELMPVLKDTEQVLADYFEIDLKKISREKQAMYLQLVKAAEAG